MFDLVAVAVGAIFFVREGKTKYLFIANDLWPALCSTNTERSGRLRFQYPTHCRSLVSITGLEKKLS